MKFKTPRESVTGQRLAQVEKKIKAANRAALDVMEKVGATAIRPAMLGAGGGISSFKMDAQPAWGKQVREGEYMPRLNCKAGKSIQEEIDALPKVFMDEVNSPLGFDGAPFKMLGLNFNNSDYILISCKDHWDFNPPSDVVEITTTEYMELIEEASQAVATT